MRVLVAGGTKFVGRQLVEFLIADGHEVTLFHRGQTGSDLFPDAARILGDRDDPPEALGRSDWDWIFDISCYTGPAAERLIARVAGHAGRYVLCSTGSVYRERSDAVPEDAPLWEPTPEHLAGDPVVAYGANKTAAEEALMRLAPAAGMEATIVRPFLVYGPWDPTDRFGWWLHRVREGAVIVPAGPRHMVHQVYVKDLARIFMAAAKARHAAGRAYNGAATRLATMADWIETASAVLGARPTVREVSPEALAEAGVKGLPCCTGDRLLAGSTERLQAELGFTSTPFAETLAETYAHMAREGRPIKEAVDPDVLRRLLG